MLGGANGREATPLETAARAPQVPGLFMLVSLGAVTAMLGVLLNLILGLSRVALAMGRRGALPPALGRLNQASEPRTAILLVGAAVAAIPVRLAALLLILTGCAARIVLGGNWTRQMIASACVGVLLTALAARVAAPPFRRLRSPG